MGRAAARADDGTWLTDLRYSIAVHESGHALVGLSYGLQIRGMHIDPDDKSSGTKFRRDDFDRSDA